MITIQEEDFNVAEEYDALRISGYQTGAIAMFVGTVREVGDINNVTGMHLQHYPGMAEIALMEIIEDARERWELENVRIVHRVGDLEPGDQIVFVGVASTHRQHAFEACEFIMDFLKTQAPFWKREDSEDKQHWVKPKQSDQQAADNWEA